MKKRYLIAGLIIIGLMILQISALDVWTEKRLEFGHVLFIDGINTNPSTIVPGKPAVLEINIENTGSKTAEDLRVKLSLPEEIGFLNDISTRKISRLNSGERNMINFSIIALPNSDEGIYSALLTVDYVSHTGEERQDNYNISIIIKSAPKIFVDVEETQIYNKNQIGEVTLKFVNNELANIKFLTVELLESEDYDIISADKKYIGDLDSDDFESVDFRLNAKKKKGSIVLPLKISYKDALNNDYSENMEAVLELRSAEELGLTSGSNVQIIVIALIVVGVAYYFYRRYKKKKKREQKF